MATTQDPKVALETFLKGYSHITVITTSSPDYAKYRASFSLDNTTTPCAIVRPQSANDVALLVKYAKTNGIDFVIRSGAHNIYGQSNVQDALTIDMRDINYVDIDKESSTAKVGGGILLAKLAPELFKEGLVTPMGTVSSVGYVGWATYGGYGPLSELYGLGADQIVAAKVVDAKGDTVEADRKLLKGIRGAGGLFGVIVELTIKVYPLTTILAGSIIYDSSDIVKTIKTFNEGYRALMAKEMPRELYVMQAILPTPFGRSFISAFTWSSSDEATGREWLQKVEALGTVLMSQVGVTTIPDWQNTVSAMVPSGIYGGSRTHSVREINNEVADIIIKNLETMGDAMLSVHQLGKHGAQPNSESVFAIREPHFMLEIVGGSATKEGRQQTVDWAASTWNDLQHIGSENLIPTAYVSLDQPSEVPGSTPLSRLFGSNAQEVFALKKQYDPEDVFKLAVPRLKNYS